MEISPWPTWIRIYYKEQNNNNKMKWIYQSLIKIPLMRHFKDLVIRTKNIENMLQRMVPQPTLMHFDYPLVEHCNLNCKYCNHFSPLADKKNVDVKIYEKDIKRMAELFASQIPHISLVGGEPLLHPELNDILTITRSYFPTSHIYLITNGILLPTKKEDFWSALNKNKITLEPTKYPLKIDWQEIEKTAAKYTVALKHQGSINKTEMQKLPIDTTGLQNPVKNYYMTCYMPGSCTQLLNGKLYPCAIAENIHYFNKRFNQQIPISPHNSIDIYDVQTKEEILQFFTKPIPMCSYCDWEHFTDNNKWERTNGEDINEWI